MHRLFTLFTFLMVIPSMMAQTLIEYGYLESVDFNWQTVTFDNTIVDPIVIVVGSSSNDLIPTVPRIRNVDSVAGTFEVRMIETTIQNDDHGSEEVSYIVVAKGTHTLPDGRYIMVSSILLISFLSLSLTQCLPLSHSSSNFFLCLIHSSILPTCGTNFFHTFLSIS